MYYITYKNLLKHGKTIDDYFVCLKTYWPLYEKWGANDVKLWQGKNNKIFCQYKVNDIDRWIKMITSKEAEKLIFSLSAIIESDPFSMNISFGNHSHSIKDKKDLLNYKTAYLRINKRVGK